MLIVAIRHCTALWGTIFTIGCALCGDPAILGAHLWGKNLAWKPQGRQREPYRSTRKCRTGRQRAGNQKKKRWFTFCLRLRVDESTATM